MVGTSSAFSAQDDDATMSANMGTRRVPSAAQTRRNVGAIWGNRILAILVPLLTTPVIANHFGLQAMGVWLLATQLASHLMLFDVGITNSLVRLLARPEADDPRLAARVLATSFYTLAGIGAAMLLVAPMAGHLFLTAFKLPASLERDARWLMLLTVASVGMTLPLRTGYSMLASRHRFDIVQACDVLGMGARLALILAVFKLGDPSVLHLGLIVFGCSVATAAVTFIYGARAQGRDRLSFHWRHFSP